MHVFYDSPSNPAANGLNGNREHTSHAYACVYNGEDREWYVQEPRGEPILLKFPVPNDIKGFFKDAIRCEFYAFYVEELRKVVKQPLEQEESADSSFEVASSDQRSEGPDLDQISEKSAPD